MVAVDRFGGRMAGKSYCSRSRRRACGQSPARSYRWSVGWLACVAGRLGCRRAIQHADNFARRCDYSATHSLTLYPSSPSFALALWQAFCYGEGGVEAPQWCPRPSLIKFQRYERDTQNHRTQGCCEVFDRLLRHRQNKGEGLNQGRE